jgi:hypothetical protein
MIDPSTRAATLAAGPARDSELRSRFLYTASAFTFLLAAAAVADVRSVHPFDHDWWLMSDLALVGGASQLLRGAGRLMLAAPPHRRWAGGRLGRVVVGASLAEALPWQ